MSLSTGIEIEFLTEEEENDYAPMSKFTHARSNNPDTEGFVFKHPRRQTTISQVQNDSIANISRLLNRYYRKAMDISEATADNMLQQFPDITIWTRLQDEKSANMRSEVYKIVQTTEDESVHRASCFVAGVFLEGASEQLNVYYGKCILFIEHRIRKQTHMLVVAGWATSGLCKGRQNQIYSKAARTSNRVFNSITVESVQCISHPVRAIESNRSLGSRKSTRTYFIDELREPWGLLTLKPWDRFAPLRKLKGL